MKSLSIISEVVWLVLKVQSQDQSKTGKKPVQDRSFKRLQSWSFKISNERLQKDWSIWTG